jgi:Asp/Glu/hydantoin racemase
MTLLVLNPNRHVAMTDAVVAQLAAALGPATRVCGWTAADGPPVIDSVPSFAQGAVAAEGALARALQAHPDTRAVLLACFGDPGLERLQQQAGGRPVWGMAQLAMAQAAAAGRRFAILTSGPAWVGLLQQRAQDWGLGTALVGVWALPVNGLALAQDPARWQPVLQAAAEEAAQAGAQCLVLGGAAFAGLGRLVHSPLPVLDGVGCAAAAWSAQRRRQPDRHP